MKSKKIRIAAAAMTLCLALTGCGGKDDEVTEFVEPESGTEAVIPKKTSTPEPTPQPEETEPTQTEPIETQEPIEEIEENTDNNENDTSENIDLENTEIINNDELVTHIVNLSVNKYDEESYSDVITCGSSDLMQSNIEKIKPKLVEMGFTTEATGNYIYKNITGPVWVARNPNNGQMFYFFQNNVFTGYVFTDTFSDIYSESEVDVLMENYYLFSKTIYNNLSDSIYEIMNNWDEIKKDEDGQYRYHAQTLNVQEHMAVDFIGQKSNERISMLVGLSNFVINDEIYSPTTFEFKDIRITADKFNQIKYTEESSDYKAPVFMDMTFKFDGQNSSAPTAEDTSAISKLAGFGYTEKKNDDIGEYMSDPYGIMTLRENEGKITITIKSSNHKFFTYADAKTEFISQLTELGITNEEISSKIDSVINSNTEATESLSVTRDTTPGTITITKPLTSNILTIEYSEKA